LKFCKVKAVPLLLCVSGTWVKEKKRNISNIQIVETKFLRTEGFYYL
jgi:hypothetical protein